MLVCLFLLQRYWGIIFRLARLAVGNLQLTLDAVMSVIKEADVETYISIDLGGGMNISNCLFATDIQFYTAVYSAIVAPVEGALIW